MCERNSDWLPLALPQWGTWPTTQACALTRNQTRGLSVYGIMPQTLSHMKSHQGVGFLNVIQDSNSYFFNVFHLSFVSGFSRETEPIDNV